MWIFLSKKIGNKTDFLTRTANLKIAVPENSIFRTKNRRQQRFFNNQPVSSRKPACFLFFNEKGKDSVQKTERNGGLSVLGGTCLWVVFRLEKRPATFSFLFDLAGRNSLDLTPAKEGPICSGCPFQHEPVITIVLTCTPGYNLALPKKTKLAESSQQFTLPLLVWV